MELPDSLTTLAHHGLSEIAVIQQSSDMNNSPTVTLAARQSGAATPMAF